MTTDIPVPSTRDLTDAFGVAPVLLDEGEATYLLEVTSGDAELRFSYDVVERSVRATISRGAANLVDLFYEGLDGISLITENSVTGLSVWLTGPDHTTRLTVTVFPTMHIHSQVLTA
ncbi:hypothetical protein AB0I60_03190 [Actinosynnema sp. NPDC050436]|uniref:hypothetical protein n=1 Tax=Actinosynnema sp. NPDC050436 TaxID=3155659 RepID=UPI0033FDD496